MKRWLITLIISAVIGFAVGYLLSVGFSFDFLKYSDGIVIGILVIVFVLLGTSYVLARQIKKLHQTEFIGDEEDAADVIIYKKFTDYTLFVQTSLTLSVLALCTTMMTTQKLALAIVSLVGLGFSYILLVFMNSLLQMVYPERPLPKANDPKYAEKLLDMSDDGEKHVILIGLYKTFQLMGVALVFGIVLSTIYSVSTGNSQLFSILVMGIILILINGKYSLSIREK